MRDVQPADPALRRTALVAAGVIGLAGVALHTQLQAWLVGLAHAESAHHRMTAVRLLVGGVSTTGVLLLATAVSLWRLGARMRVARRFPPPGVRVVRDTVILRDATATRLGGMVQVVAVGVVLSVIGLAVTTWRLLGVIAP